MCGVSFGSWVMNMIDHATSKLLTGNDTDHVFIAETLDVIRNLTSVLSTMGKSLSV